MEKKLIYFFLLWLILCNCKLVQAHSNLSKPISPFRIAGNLYFVGNNYIANYLVVTPKGNILINSGCESDVPMIKENIEKLGFKFSDTKILLISHAHVDHSGGSASIKKETGATLMVMNQDVPVIESGGKSDFHYGNSNNLENFYPPTKVDHILQDGEKVKLANTVLTAHLTPGHTKGCTTWTMQVNENGKKYNVVIVGSPYVNPGYQLIHNKTYPTIADDYQHMFKVLKSLPCDIFLGAHGVYFDLEKKYALQNKNKINPFIDPKGYKQFVLTTEKEFYTDLEKARA